MSKMSIQEIKNKKNCAQRNKSRPCTANGRLRVKGKGKVSSHLERGRHQPPHKTKKQTKKVTIFLGEWDERQHLTQTNKHT